MTHDPDYIEPSVLRARMARGGPEVAPSRPRVRQATSSAITLDADVRVEFTDVTFVEPLLHLSSAANRVTAGQFVSGS